MTIKEVEEVTGIQRANIRFYEAEGFLNPEREKNGYRNYSEKDVDLLKKIKLLRSLHISLEEIKAMHQGEQDLSNTLEKHIVQLMQQQEDLGKSQYVCEKMQRDGATYEKLNTEQHLLVLKNCRPEVKEKEEWIEKDTPEPVKAPWLRIFARLFDYLLYATVWIMLVFLCLRVFSLERNVLVAAVAYSLVINMLIAFLLEPLFLCWFGTTPGKALFGLWVSYDVGNEIPMEIAWARSWRAILGRHDWKYHDIFQMINIYNAMAEGKPLDWDYTANTTIELKDKKPWRRIVFILAAVGCVFTIACICQSMRMLPNRGNVTTEEFVENFNTMQSVIYNGGWNILETGEWASKHRFDAEYFTLTVEGETRDFESGGFPKKFDIIEEDGVVTEVGFFYETRNPKEYLEDFDHYMLYVALAFVEAEQNYNVFTYKNWADMKVLIEQTIYGNSVEYISLSQQDDIKEFSSVIGGVELICDIELQGYELWKDHYVAKEGKDTYYSVRFSARKVEE